MVKRVQMAYLKRELQKSRIFLHGTVVDHLRNYLRMDQKRNSVKELWSTIWHEHALSALLKNLIAMRPFLDQMSHCVHNASPVKSS